jgi:ATP-dependent RNA helicase RhlE
VAEGRDVLGIAQTGTGKTAAFALPILHRLESSGARPQGRRSPRVLVVAPTRELAAQIGDSFKAYGRHLHLKVSVVFGGVGQRPQEEELRRGVDVLVACPGRLLDLVGQGPADLSQVEILVLDEADRMLDMGFLPDIRKIVARVPKERQTLLFSATMPEEIRDLVSGLLHDPVTVQVAPAATAADTVDQSFRRVQKDGKPAVLSALVEGTDGRVLVFTRTKHGADRVAKRLTRDGIEARAIHGDKSQGARTSALEGFRDGSVPVLVASDIAARGLDIDEIRLVVNYDVPADPDTYVHRIGRTGRAGASGRAVTFVTDEEGESARDIQKRIGREIPWTDSDSVPNSRPAAAKPASKPAPKPAQQSSKPREGGRRNSGNDGRSGRNRNDGRGRDENRRGSEGRSERRDRTGDSQRREGSGEGQGRNRRRRRGGNGPAAAPRASDDSKPNLIGRIWSRLTGGGK